MNPNKPKQVIVMRTQYPDGKGGIKKLRRGKEIAQASHASIAFLTNRLYDPISGPPWKALEMKAQFSQAELEWIDDKFTKVTVQVHSEKELLDLHEAAIKAGLMSHLIQDEGLTEFNKIKTYTCLAIGPDYSDRIDPVTRHLKLY